MNKNLKKALIAGAAGVALLGSTAGACDTDADTVNDNITTDAENFKIPRKVVFYNSISDVVLYTVEGYCSIEIADPANFKVTCKVKDGNKEAYTRDYLGRSDNVLYFAIQTSAANVSPDHRTIIYKPTGWVPNIEIR